MNRREQIELAAQRFAETKRTEEAKAQAAYDFEVGAEWADENPNWIPVTEDLPKSNEEMLVCVTSVLGKARRTAWYFSDKGVWFDNGIVSGVTHWMKLPGFPQ